MSKAGPSKLLIALALAATATLTACLPTAPAPGGTPASSPEPTTTTTTAPAPAPVVPSCASGVGPEAAGSPTEGAGESLSVGEAAFGAAVATNAAITDPEVPGTAGSVPLTVTATDGDGRPSVTTLQVTDATSAAAAATALATDVVGDGGAVIAVEPQHTMSTQTTATDPARPSQWALTQLDFEDVWNTTSGGGLCVAVLDTGAETTHPDLAGNIAATWDATGQGVEDHHGHGTHVAGVIAATANNGVGIAGAAPGVKLMIGKVLTNEGTGTDAWTANGIIWAVDNGASVINLSLGATCPESSPSGCASTAMQTAVDYAQTNDVVVVAAAGNNGDPNNPPANPSYNHWSWPAAFSWPIAVASTNASMNRSSFSTQASYVDVAAPGSSVYSTYPGGAYASMSGTSMATPHVTALVALLRASHPSESAAQIAARITSPATDLGTAGRDNGYGWGLIDPGAALAA